MSFRPVLEQLLAGRDLSRATTERLFGALMDGALSEVQKTALLVALRAKGESVEEITGAASAMRARALTIPHRAHSAIDTCGTGGDGKGTFNISTAAALVAAAAGATVAKHGNRSVSSRSGSADVLERLGVPLDLSPEALGRVLERVGIAFLFAPTLHPAMREVMPVRKELAVRTLFNVLGPLTNPARAQRQLMGVFADELVEPIARVLGELGAERALVVHGSDGLDEITTTGPTRVAELEGGSVRVWELDPRRLGIAVCRPEELAGGSIDDNAERLRGVLDGEPGALQEITVLNAGAALWVAGVGDSIEDGLARARASLANGAARTKLDELVAVSLEEKQ